MKKLILILIAMVVLFLSCQPEEEIQPVNPKGGAYEKTTYSDSTLTVP